LKLKRDGELALISGLYAMAPFIQGPVAGAGLPVLAENNGIFIDVPHQPGHGRLRHRGFHRAQPAGLAVVRDGGPTSRVSRPSSSASTSATRCGTRGVNFYRLLLAAGVPARLPAGHGHHARRRAFTTVCPEISRDTARDLAAFCKG